MKITIGHLYPDLLNLYGDRGNIQCLMKRCQWRGIEAETIAYEIDDTIDFSKLDIVLLGGGSDREQMLVCEKLKTIQKDFKAYVEDNGVVIAASYWGKFKTTFQMIGVVLLIFNIPALSTLTTIIVWIALALTVISLVDYIVKNAGVLTEGKM